MNRTRTLLLAVALVLPLGLAATPQTPAPPDSQAPQKPDDKKAPLSVTGKWNIELNMDMGQATPSMELKQEGQKITGTYTGRYGAAPIAGTLKDRAIELQISVNVDGTAVEVQYSGEVAADGLTMKGTASLGPAGDGTWLARKQVKS